jgi:DNA-directed RNA polymerase subunit RPC12/RpoP
MGQFFPPPPPPRPVRTKCAIAYQCTKCGQRVAFMKRSTDADDKAVVVRIKADGQWACPECGGQTLERVTP